MAGGERDGLGGDWSAKEASPASGMGELKRHGVRCNRPMRIARGGGNTLRPTSTRESPNGSVSRSQSSPRPR
eukprot:scaffold28014_cov33-Tisochrysis_lutea.AAC.4